jgi:protein SCO1/2
MMLGAALVAIVGAFAVWAPWGAGVAGDFAESKPVFRGLRILPPEPAPDFMLLDQDRRPFAMHAQRGRVVLLMFGYTYCPDVCPAALGLLTQVPLHLGRDAGSVRLVFITTDPARDTPERLKAYLRHFSPQIVGLTGSRAMLDRVYQAYGVFPFQYTTATMSTGYLVSHKTAIYLIDPSGYLRVSYPWGAAPASVTHDIRLLLAGR